MQKKQCDICHKSSEDIAEINDTILDRFKRYGYTINEELYGHVIKVCKDCFMKV